MHFPDFNIELIISRLKQTGNQICTAESCTGGMIATLITDIPGSSAVFSRGYVTYSDQAKIDMLGVRSATLELYGAVSAQTVSEMASGALIASGDEAEYSVAISGIAGPDGGSDEKPVGLVFIGVLKKGALGKVSNHIFEGDRQAIRHQAANAALHAVYELM
ncbi:MAG: CinA family protein [Alphaproteobacteria bacterium]|nr:CinA family protein [Alphaproteobacteria bacterium]